jgi:hypothetical protein
MQQGEYEMDTLVKSIVVFVAAYCLCLCIDSYAQVPSKKLNDIYINVFYEFNKQYKIKSRPRLTESKCLLKGNASWAYADIKKNRICVNYNLVRGLENDSQIATVLYHELAHIYLRHESSSLENEKNADRIAKNLLSKSKIYNLKDGASLFLFFHEHTVPVNDPLHPCLITRYKYFMSMINDFPKEEVSK